MTQKNWCLCLAAVAFSTLVVGCGPGVELARVEGVITKDGKPADSILVNFMPEPSVDGAMSSAITDDNGRYQLVYQGEDKVPGAVVGSHRVIVNDLVPENFRGQGRPPEPRVRPETMKVGSTPFRFQVEPGQQSIDFDLDDPGPTP